MSKQISYAQATCVDHFSMMDWTSMFISQGLFIVCLRKYSQSEFRKTIIYSIESQSYSKDTVWLAIEERVFRVELHLCMKGYCWRESWAKIAAILKTKMQLMLHVWKKHLGNKRIWMSAKFWIEIEIFRKFEETNHSQKYMENTLTLTVRGFPMFAHWCGSQK